MFKKVLPSERAKKIIVMKKIPHCIRINIFFLFLYLPLPATCYHFSLTLNKKLFSSYFFFHFRNHIMRVNIHRTPQSTSSVVEYCKVSFQLFPCIEEVQFVVWNTAKERRKIKIINSTKTRLVFLKTENSYVKKCSFNVHRLTDIIHKHLIYLFSSKSKVSQKGDHKKKLSVTWLRK